MAHREIVAAHTVNHDDIEYAVIVYESAVGFSADCWCHLCRGLRILRSSIMPGQAEAVQECETLLLDHHEQFHAALARGWCKGVQVEPHRSHPHHAIAPIC